MTMAAKKRTDVPLTLFDFEEETATEPKRKKKPEATTPLEALLGRKRDPETGALVPKKKPAKRRSVASSTFERTLLETQEMIDSRDWTACAARHLVALYDLMHRKTYGVEPTMTGSERYRSTMIAGSFVLRVFGGDFEKALEYLRWVWTREMGREKWRRENGREAGRLSLRSIFSGSFLLDDYRVAMARKR